MKNVMLLNPINLIERAVSIVLLGVTHKSIKLYSKRPFNVWSSGGGGGGGRYIVAMSRFHV